jgi:NAD(P)-dependent dehydrogenase (short-subunit alcohol dehydrogenase family)
MSKALEGRIALVTGASRGIGAAVAERFAAEGAHVVAVARTVGGLEELDDRIRAAGGNATLVPLDLKDGDAIDRLGAALYERWGRLDVLVGNAGVLGTITPVHHLSPKVFDDLFAINVRANWRLMRSCEPLLRASDAGRAIFVTSGAANAHRPYWSGYAATKAALEEFVKTWAAEIPPSSNVRVNLLSPGPIRTAMRAQAMPGEDPETLPTPDVLGDLFVALASPSCDKQGETIRFSR